MHSIEIRNYAIASAISNWRERVKIMPSSHARIYWDKEFNWQEYAKLYEEYCSTPENYYRLTARAILNQLSIRDDQTIVDAACGTGIITEEIFRTKSPRIIGIDASEQALAKYDSKFNGHSKIKPIRGNLESIDSLLSIPVDQVIVASALWNFKWPEFLAKTTRVLKNDGVLAFNIPAAYLGEKNGFLYEIAQAFEKETTARQKLFSIEERALENALKCANFGNLEKHAYQFTMSLDSLKHLFAVYRLRVPFIFFNNDIPLDDRQAISDRVLNRLLEQWSSGHTETGYVYLCKRK